MSRSDGLLERIFAYQTSLLTDLAAAIVIFIAISAAWTYAPEEWPQLIYYALLLIGLFGYFRLVAPDPVVD